MPSLAAALALSVLLAVQPLWARAQSAVFTVDADVALSSLASLSDSHLTKLAQTLQLLAASDAARSRDWNRIRGPLAALRGINVPALLWFALPDGSYWTVDTGRQSATLRGRAYFPKLLAKNTVIGDLVVSTSTRKAVAIVAVPILAGDTVAGALGASVYLDKLSAQLRREMNLPKEAIFFSIDSRSIVALNWDPSLILLDARKISPALDKAFGEMLTRDAGTETYEFRGKLRTVIYRRSPITGWWYALGRVRE